MPPPVKILHSRTAGNKPVSLATGQLAINEADRVLYYSDPTSGVTDLIGSAAGLVANSNLIINGAMEVDQINHGNSLAISANATGYAIDMVKHALAGAQVLASQQVADAPSGFTNSIKYTVTTANNAPGATDKLIVQMPIEGNRMSRLAFGTSGAQNVVLGFWVKAFYAGTYVVALENAAGNRGISASFSVNASNTWQYVTVSFPGDVTGTWVVNNALAMYVVFWLMNGSSFATGSPNTWAATAASTGGITVVNVAQSTSGTFQITGLSLHAGTAKPSASRSLALQLSFSETQFLCRRYWQKSYSYGVSLGTVTTVGAWTAYALIGGSAGGPTAAGNALYFNPPMMAAPAMTFYSPATGTSGKYRDLVGAVDVNSSSLTLLGPGENGIGISSADNNGQNAEQTEAQWAADARM